MESDGQSYTTGQDLRSTALIDLIAISTAIVHCDVVVTERQWTDFAERTKLGEQSKTSVLRELKGLEPHLLKAAAG